ncbi:MAG: hypothetical protein M1833_000440 [Piccolia ochrophora]|nr:MAG: hypothetical protein M1833_000440 [Piccolia ochrophora]
MPKRPKPSSSSDVPTDGEMRLHYQQRTLNKLTMTTLKAFLATKSQSTSGKKADLLDRIEGWFETKA